LLLRTKSKEENEDYGVLIMFIDVLNEHSAYILKVEGYSEDGVTSFIKNVDNHLTVYPVS
jgi:hypothetical protein